LELRITRASGRPERLRPDASIKIAIASDHAGYAVLDFGTWNKEPVDYPEYIRAAARSVASGETSLGIVVGGSGNGEAITANKVRLIRCAVCWNEESARLAKEHNNANMIALGARMVSAGEALRVVDTWLSAEFQGGRHQRRVELIE